MHKPLFIVSLLLVACEVDTKDPQQSPDTASEPTNQSPSAEITSHADTDSFVEGERISFLGHVQDLDHYPGLLSVRWLSGGTVLCDSMTPDSDGTTACEITMSPDYSEVTLEVIDSENARGEASIQISVREADAPNATLLSPTETGQYYSDQKVLFEGLIMDEEDPAERLSATWTSDLDGVLAIEGEASTTGELSGTAYLSEGTHLILLEVEDSAGKTDSDSVLVRVGPPNSAPLCEFVTPSDQAAFAYGEPASFSALVSDADIDASALSVIWSSDKDGDLAEQNPNSQGELHIEFDGLSINQHSISLMVTDELGESCTATRQVRVGAPPTISIGSPLNGSTHNEGEGITYSAIVSDAEDLPTTLSLEWTLNGQPFSTQSANSFGEATFTGILSNLGTSDLLVTVTDSDGLSASDQVQWVTNGLPSPPTVELLPASPTAEDDLNVLMALESTDPEGGAVSYSYAWFVDGLVQPAHTSQTLPASATAKGEVWSVSVTPNDGLVDGNAGMANTTIINTAPTLTSVTISPPEPSHNDSTLLCDAVASDPDEVPTLTYEWFLGNSSIGSGAVIDLSTTSSMPNGIVSCQVTAMDGSGESATSSASRLLTNRAPIISSVEISPNVNVTTSTAVTCDALAADPDGEVFSVDHVWTVGGNSFSGASLSLDPSMVSPGEPVLCTITITDGSGETATAEASVAVENTEPVLSEVTLTTSGDLTTGALLTCNYMASDADLESLSVTYLWQNLTTSMDYSASTDSLQLDPTAVSPMDEVSCVVTVTDGHGGTDSLNAVGTVFNTPPVLSDVTLSYSGDLTTGALLTCDYLASDADLESLAASYLWRNQTTGQDLASTLDSLQLDPSIVSPMDEISCEVTVVDPNGDTATMSVTEAVVNSEPSFVDEASISTTGLTVGSVWTCTANGVDPDDGSLIPTFAWQDPSGNLIAEGPELVLSPANSDPLESLLCIASIEDSHGGSLSSSASETVANSLPVVTGLEFEQSSVQTNDVLSVIATVNDPDETNDTVYLYEWYVTDAITGQDALVQSGNSEQLDGSLHFDKNDSVRVVLTASDSHGSATPVSSVDLSVSNSAPIVTEISVDPDPAYAQYDSLTCTVVDYVDADFDAVTFVTSWTNEAGDVYSGEVVDWTVVTAGEWTCTVEASDSEDSSSSSAVLTVEPPSCDGVSCGVDGTCVSDGSSFTCNCRGGFEGTFCELDIDECLVNNGGCTGGRSTCVNTVGSHYCVDDSQVLVYPEDTNLTAENYYNVAVVLVNGKAEFPVDRADYYYNSVITYRQIWYDHEEVGQFLFDSPDGVKAFFDEVSYGKAAFSGVVVNWYDDYSVPKSANDIFYDHDFYIAEAYSAIDPTQYDIFMVVGLADSGSTQIGWGMGNSVPDEFGGRLYNKGITYLINSAFMNEVGRTRFDGWILPSVPWAHELFHTVGIFGHSNTLWCYPTLADYTQATTDEERHLNSSVMLSDMCESMGYGDPFSLMGERLWGTHPSVASKLEMGWLDESEYTVLDATGFFLETAIELYPHNQSSLSEQMAVQILVPEFEVVNASGNSFFFDRVTLETRSADGFDVYLNALGTDYRPYGSVGYWYLEGQTLWSSQYNDNYFELDHPIDTTGVFVYLDHTDTSSQSVFLLDGNPANLGILTSQYSPKGHKGNAGKFANSMIPVGGTFDSTLLPFSLSIETGENGGADGEVRVRIIPSP